MVNFANKLFKKAQRNGTVQHYTIESSVRVSSEPNKQNLVCLGPDKLGVFFCRGPVDAAQQQNWESKTLAERDYDDPYGGDMGFQGLRDMILLLNDSNIRNLSSSNNTSENQQDSVGNIQFLELTQANPFLHRVLLDKNEVIFGPQKHILKIKSATIGSQINYKLIKCRARYTIPKAIARSVNMKMTAETEGDAIDGFGPMNVYEYQQATTTDMDNYNKLFAEDMSQFIGLQCCNLIQPDYLAATRYRAIAGAGVHYNGTDFETMRKCLNFMKQPGAGLSVVPHLLKILEIVDTKSGKLMPGQEATYTMEADAKLFNETLFSLTKASFCLEGEIFYFLKVYGEDGHETYVQDSTVGPNQNIVNQEIKDSSEWYGGAFHNQLQSRPLLGTMAAHVDVTCFKKLCVGFVEKTERKPTRKRVILDDTAFTTTTTNPTSHSSLYVTNDEHQSTNRFVDAFPSFFQSSEAYVDTIQ